MVRLLSVLHSIQKKSILQPVLRRNASTVSLPSQADVVIVGGGIAGCSTLYALAHRGVRAVLLERARITSGTTWHTAGLVWSLRPNDVEVQLLACSRVVYSGLEAEGEQPAGWTNNGGLFISHTQERTDEYARLATLGRALNVSSEVLEPAEVRARWPLLAGPLRSALFCPADGTVDPAMATAAQLRIAKAKGAKVFEGTPVLQIQTGPNSLGHQEVKGVVTPQGIIKTKCVVNCAGAWGGGVRALSGRAGLPLLAMKHAYIVSESIPGARALPNVRDHDHAFYFRIQGDAICMGGYEGNPHLLDKGLPDNFEFQLYELDWGVFATHVDGAGRLCPALTTAGVRSTVCGPESFTPDHKPLLGEDTQLFGLYHNCGYNSAGMMFSPGCAEQMADWIIHGRPSLPMFTFDVRRFSPEQLKNVRWLRERSHEAYARNYDLVFPWDEPLGGRGVQVSPVHPELQQSGAVWQTRAGWERPAFFLKDRVIPLPAYDWGGHYGHACNTDKRYEDILAGDHTFGFSKHHDIIGAEALQCRHGAALFDLSYYGKFFLSGPEAQLAADWIFTANLQRPDTNKVVYSCILNERGGVEADLTVSIVENGSGRFGEPVFKGRGFYVVASGFSGQHTLAHMRKVIHTRGLDATVTDVTSQIGILSLQGPNSQKILEKVLDRPLSEFGVSTCELLPGGQGRALRVGWAGELGWELHAPGDSLRDLLQRLHRIPGWSHAGWRALTALSAEKGYHLWNADVRADDTPVEAGLGFTCRKGGSYTGSEEVERQRKEGIHKRYAFFTLNEKRPLFGLEAVYRDGRPCGFLRRGDYAFLLDAPIGVAYLRHHKGETVSKQYVLDGDYHIESLGIKYPATVHLTSPFDPKGRRIHGDYD